MLQQFFEYHRRLGFQKLGLKSEFFCLTLTSHVEALTSDWFRKSSSDIFFNGIKI